jgi:hypothetical protein
MKLLIETHELLDLAIKILVHFCQAGIYPRRGGTGAAHFLGFGLPDCSARTRQARADKDDRVE